jgi:N-methylhydantoinase A
MKIGIEVGGTFTDLIGVGPDGLIVEKVPSVPSAPEIGALAALRQIDYPIDGVLDLVHGSTVATNAVLERKGAPIAFIATEGFRDILFLQRHDRRSVYDIHYAKPQPPVRRRDCFEARERMGADGVAIRELDEEHFQRHVVPALKEGAYDSVAICLLNSYANPAHEQRLQELLDEWMPGLRVTISANVAREFREFERASSTSVSAYVQPVVDSYISRLEAALADEGFRGHFSIMQSNGGRLPAKSVRRSALAMLLSGPAAGVVGAIRQAERSAIRNIITFDMGGTSTDVCLVRDGQPELTNDFDIDGLPIRSPILDIVTVGAGGGSLIWRDEGDMLRVGPRSAGANPGPACYGRGGAEPTVTDAHVVRGVLRPTSFLGGKMALDANAAARALAGISGQFDQSADQFAKRAIQLANANIVRAIQLVSTERGHDPRDFTLVPFGGAGPLHACAVADELGVDRILVPPHAGVLSAFGLLASDYVHFETRTQRTVVRSDADLATIRGLAEELEQLARARLKEAGFSTGVAISLAAGMRSVGQAFEITVPLAAHGLQDLTVAGLRSDFQQAHRKVFFHDIEQGRDVEVVALRLRAAIPAGEAPLLSTMSKPGAPTDAQTVAIDGGQTLCQVHQRASLGFGNGIAGPAIVDEPTTTTFIPEGWTGRLDNAGNLIIQRNAADVA